MPMFDNLATEVQDLENAADAQTAVLVAVKNKLDAAIAAAGSLSDADKAQLQSISDSLGAETPKIVAATLANTPADPNAPPAPAAA